MRPKNERFRVCKGCRKPMPVEEMASDWVLFADQYWHYRRLLYCDRCWENKVERNQVKELEAWPDFEETLEEGFEMICFDGQFGDGLDPMCERPAPEESFVMPGEKTKP